MTTGDPAQHVFWLASRALGIVAIALLACSVALGLALSGRLAPAPGRPARLKRMHEASALVALAFIVAHAGVLLGDAYLRPGMAGIALPFQLGYRPLWTGFGIIAAWLSAILGLSFYARRRIGVRTWRWLHRWTLAVYVLAVGHAIGAGTDGRAAWMIVLLTVLTTPILFACTYRLLPAPRPASSLRSRAAAPLTGSAAPPPAARATRAAPEPAWPAAPPRTPR